MKEKSKSLARLFYFISVLSYVVSGLASVELFWYMSDNLFKQIVLVIIVCLYQTAALFTFKFIFDIYNIETIFDEEKSKLKHKITYKHSSLSRLLFLIAYIFCTSFSIVASASLVYNANSSSANKAMVEQTNLDNQIKAKELVPDIINVKKQEIQSLENGKINTIKSYDNNKSLWSYKAATKRGDIEDKKTAAVADIDNKKSKISSDMDNIFNQLLSPIQYDSSKTSNFGISGIIKDKDMQNNFSILFGAGIDFIGALFTFMYMKEKYHLSPTPDKPRGKRFNEGFENIKSSMGKINPFKKKNSDIITAKNEAYVDKIPMHSPTHRENIEINDNKPHRDNIIQLKKSHKKNNIGQHEKLYLDYALNHLKSDGTFQSISNISKGLKGQGVNLTPEMCRTIHNNLKDREIIKTSRSPRATWLNVAKEEVI